MAEYIESLENQKKYNKNSIVCYTNRLNDFLSFFKNKKDLNSISKEDVEKFLKSLDKSDISNAKYNQFITAIRGFYKYLEKSFGVNDLFSDIKLKKSLEKIYLNEDQILAFLDIIKAVEDNKKTIFLIYVLTELKIQDILKLDKNDIEIKADQLIINVSKNKLKKEYDLSASPFKERLNGEISELIKESKKLLFESNKQKEILTAGFNYIFKKFKKHLPKECSSVLMLKNPRFTLPKKEKHLAYLESRKYKFHKLISNNDESSVYLVYDRQKKSKLALKILNSQVFNPELEARFENEFLTLKSLNHPLLPRVYDFVCDKSKKLCYFTLEYMDAAPISDFVQKLSIKEAILIIYNFIDLFKYLNSKNIIHFDINPNNILFKNSAAGKLNIKLIDFGLSGVTETTIPKGTNYFIAPEIILNKKASTTSDLYSLGITIYHLLTARFPFNNQNTDSYLKEIKQNKYVEISEYLNQIPDELEELISKMTRYNPEQRYAEFHEIEKDISSLIEKHLLDGETSVNEISLKIPAYINFNNYKEHFNKIFNIVSSEKVYYPEVYSILLSGEAGSGKKRLLSELSNAAYIKKKPVYRFEFSNDPYDCLGNIIEFCLLKKKIKIDHSDSTNNDKKALSINTIKKLAYSLAGELSKNPSLVIFEACENLKPDALAFIKLFLDEIKNSKKSFLSIFSINTENEEGAKLAELLKRKLPNKANYLEWKLAHLNKEEVARLCESALNKAYDSSLIDYLYKYSKGNAGQVLMLLSYLSENNSLILRNNIVQVLETKKDLVPGAIEDIIENKISKLSKNEKHVLSFLSILEVDLNVNLLMIMLCEFYETISKADFILAVEALIHKQLVFKTDDFTDVSLDSLNSNYFIKIADDYIKMQSHKQINTKIMKLMHLKIAQYLEASLDLQEKYSETIGFHFSMGSNQEKAFLYLDKKARDLYNQGLWERSALLFERALKDVEKLPDLDPKLVDSILFNAENLFCLSEYENAIKKLDILKYKKLALNEEIKYNLLLGKIQNRQGNSNEALEFYEKAYALSDAENLHQSQNKAEILLNKLSLFLTIADFQKSQEIIEAISDYKELKNKEKAQFYYLSGLYAYYNENVSMAIESFKLSLSFAQSDKNYSAIIRAFNMLGACAFLEHNYNASIEFYEKAIEISEAISDIYGKSIIYQNIGASLHNIGKLSEALQNYLKASQILDDLNEPIKTEMILFSIALIYSEIGDYETCTKYLEKSQKMAEKSGNKLTIAYVNFLEADLLYQNMTYDIALEKYEIARDLFSKLNLNYQKVQTLINIANIYVQKTQWNKVKVICKVINSISSLNDGLKTELNILLIKLAIANKDLVEAKNIINNNINEKDIEFLNYQTQFSINSILAQFYEKISNIEKANEYAEKLDFQIKTLAQNMPETRKTLFLKRQVIKEAKEISRSIKIKQGIKSEVSFKLENLMDLQISLTSQSDPQKLINAVLDNVIIFTNAIRGFVLLKKELFEKLGKDSFLKALNKKAYEYHVIASRNFEQDELSNSIDQISKTIIDKTLLEDKIIQVANALEAFSWSRSISNSKLKSIITFPIVMENEIIGLFYLDDPNNVGSFDDVDLKYIQTLAVITSNLINNLALLTSLTRQNKKIESLNNELSKRLLVAENEVQSSKSLLSHMKSDGFTLKNYNKIITNNKTMLNLFATIEKVKDTELSVLIGGETGSGKELIARSIHYGSKYANKPFLSENCGAVSESLLESELFGHVKGAFTDAIRDKKGLFELANGGTIFLDEIGEMSLGMQKKLLRVLQEKKVRPLGSNNYIDVDFRIICATHRNLDKMVKAEEFRSDLFFRINAVLLKLPALRERKDDIPLLVDHFLRIHSKDKPKKIDKKLLQLLIDYSWPGNIRQLENEIKRLVFTSNNEIIRSSDSTLSSQSLYQEKEMKSLDEIEKEAILKAIQISDGKLVEAAKLLSINRRTLSRKIEKYGLL
ncbi:MAG: sigma 54-interacting transcriptional regulator [Pseudomonadota bacterium]